MTRPMKAISTPGVRLARKSLNESRAYEPVRMLVGVPISVLIPITFEAKTSGISNTRGFSPNESAFWIPALIFVGVLILIATGNRTRCIEEKITGRLRFRLRKDDAGVCSDKHHLRTANRLALAVEYAPAADDRCRTSLCLARPSREREPCSHRQYYGGEL